MAMQKVTRLVFVNEPAKAAKAAMATVFGVMNKSRRGVGYDQIDTSPAPKGKTHFFYEPGHLVFGILVDIAIIPPRAGETENLNFADMDNPPVDMHAPDWRRSPVADVMIAENVEQRHIVAVAQSRQIFRRQVTAGEDQLDAAYGWTAALEFEQVFYHCIGNAEDFHFQSAAVRPIIAAPTALPTSQFSGKVTVVRSRSATFGSR